jgi:hypothetical protein
VLRAGGLVPGFVRNGGGGRTDAVATGPTWPGKRTFGRAGSYMSIFSPYK